MLTSFILLVLTATVAEAMNLHNKSSRLDRNHLPPWVKPCHHDDGANPEEQLLVYDSNNDVCLNATLQLRISLLDRISYCVDTTSYCGVCEGDKKVLFGEELVGPAILFAWKLDGGQIPKERWPHSDDSILIQWGTNESFVFIDDIKINLTKPNTIEDNPGRIIKILGDLDLFPTKIGDTYEIDFEKIEIGRFEELDFCSGQYTVVNLAAPITLLVIGASVFSLFLCLGAYTFYKGTRKKSIAIQDQPC